MKKIIGIFIFIIGIIIISYPLINDFYQDKKQDAIINSFAEAMNTLSDQNNKSLEGIVVTMLNDDKVVVNLEDIESMNSEDKLNNREEAVYSTTLENTDSDKDEVGLNVDEESVDSIKDEVGLNTNEESVDSTNLEIAESIAPTEDEKVVVYSREDRNQYITSAWPVEAILSIEKIDLLMPIIEGTRSEYLDVSPCSVLGASKPWESGNYSVAGHRSLTYGRHFNRLNELGIGDEIVVTDLNGISYTYRVNKTSIVHESDTSVLLNNGYDEITLITCDPIGEKNPDYRLIVKAKKK